MSFDTNAWYSIQNFGNDFFLACQNVGNCMTGESGLGNPELFQLATTNGSQPYYIRPKALDTDSNGNAYCVNINTGVPAIATCTTESALWGIGDWNGKDAGDGKFFISLPRGDSLRLSLSSNNTFLLQSYTDLPQSQQNLMQWGVSSRAAINDQSYSTVPAAITGGAGALTTTTTTATNSTSSVTSSVTSGVISTSSSSSSSSSASSSSSSASSYTSNTSNTASVTLTSDPSNTSGTTTAPSTVTTVVTPTVTVSPSPASSAFGTSTPSVAPGLVNGAERLAIDLKAMLMLMIMIPQILHLLC